MSMMTLEKCPNFFMVVFSARKSSKIRKNVKMFVCTIMLIKDIVIDAGLLA